MKNDVKKVNEITTEMRINDLIYKIIDDELDDMIYDCDELDKEFEKLLQERVKEYEPYWHKVILVQAYNK